MDACWAFTVRLAFVVWPLPLPLPLLLPLPRIG
jgi:hypothetical protein